MSDSKEKFLERLSGTEQKIIHAFHAGYKAGFMDGRVEDQDNDVENELEWYLEDLYESNNA